MSDTVPRTWIDAHIHVSDLNRHGTRRENMLADPGTEGK